MAGEMTSSSNVHGAGSVRTSIRTSGPRPTIDSLNNNPLQAGLRPELRVKYGGDDGIVEAGSIQPGELAERSVFAMRGSSMAERHKLSAQRFVETGVRLPLPCLDHFFVL